MVRSRPRHVPLEGPLGFRHDRTAPPGASWGAGRRGDRLGGKALPGLPRAGGVWGGGGTSFHRAGGRDGALLPGKPPALPPPFLSVPRLAGVVPAARLPTGACSSPHAAARLHAAADRAPRP